MTTYNDTSEQLLQHASKLGPSVFTISKEIFEEIPQFSFWTGASLPDQHHYGKHGLVYHTTEVVKIMTSTKQALNLEIPDDQIFLAGLFHDIGKVWDYKPTNPEFTEWTGTQHKRRIHHISRSALVWNKAVDKTGLFTDINDDITHAILAHYNYLKHTFTTYLQHFLSKFTHVPA